MEKQRQLLAATAESYISGADKIQKYIRDPIEKAAQLEKLKQLAFEHAQVEAKFELQCKALEFVTQKRKEIPDLEITKVC
jgi:hypothetical protein